LGSGNYFTQNNNRYLNFITISFTSNLRGHPQNLRDAPQRPGCIRFDDLTSVLWVTFHKYNKYNLAHCGNIYMRYLDSNTKKGDDMADQETALTIKRNFSRTALKFVKQFMNLPIGNICDAQQRIGALDYRIKPVSETARFCGTALTVDSGPRDNLAAWAALEIAKPGDVILIATGEHLASSVAGDLYVGMAKNAGVVGIVTDGAVRDRSGINEVGIPVFARGICANSPWKNGPGRVGLPIVIGGVCVNAGDVVAGDQDGVVIVERRAARAVAEGLAAVLAKEKQMEASVKAGMTLPGWLEGALKSKGVKYID
jgi:4-hydroxy-4-methyl-2-oxoglutarate aldolase